MMKDHHDNLSIARQTKGKLPRLPFADIKNEILGDAYDLSLVFVGRNRAIQLHKQWKHKNDPVNILSFPLSKTEGEIFISLEKARSECKKFNRAYHNYLAFLFIHGCAHLKGYAHGAAMEAFEKKVRAKFGV